MLDLRNIDCMELMKQYEDKYFDLAIVDPPYGINIGNQKASISPQKGNGNRRRLEWNSNWDSEIPNEKYFTELKRVSKNQIIWGGNYFIDYLSNTRCVLIWDKVQEFSGSDFEMAWTSFDKASKIFRYARCMMHHYPDGEEKIHPTQKPIKLYEWILKNYADWEHLGSTSRYKVLDTHLGSGSSAIASHYFGCQFVGCEIDKEYFEKTMKRIKEKTAQTQISFNH